VTSERAIGGLLSTAGTDTKAIGRSSEHCALGRRRKKVSVAVQDLKDRTSGLIETSIVIHWLRRVSVPDQQQQRRTQTHRVLFSEFSSIKSIQNNNQPRMVMDNLSIILTLRNAVIWHAGAGGVDMVIVQTSIPTYRSNRS